MSEHAGDPPHPVRLAMEGMARGMTVDPAGPTPPPPYHVHGVSLIYLRCAFDPDAVRRLLPPQFEPDDGATGTIAIYTVAAGTAIAPYEAGYFGVSVKGFDGPDGDVGCLKLGDFRSGVWGEIYRRHYLEGSRPGWAHLARDGDQQTGEAGPPGQTALRIAARRTENISDEVSSINRFLGKRPGRDGFNVWTVAATGRWRDLADVAVEITDNAPDALKLLRPRDIVWPVMVEDLAMTFSPPDRADRSASEMTTDIVRTEMIDLFSRLGRPALIVGPGGQVLHVNEAAAALDGDGLQLSAGALRSSSRAAQADLDAAIAEVIATRRAAGPIALKRLSGGMPLLVQALPLTPLAAGDAAVLLLIFNPEQPQRGDAAGALRLLGLTAAEARLASEVGGGKSPRDAAAHLSISEGTARTTLKTVFGKLAVSRQSELAQLVARIEAG